MQKHDNERLTKAITKLEELLAILKSIGEEIPTVHRKAHSMDKYLSGSGNTTWKLYCDDGEVVWLRISQEAMLRECGVWEMLTALDLDYEIAVNFALETVEDGDFHKAISINHLSTIR